MGEGIVAILMRMLERGHGVKDGPIRLVVVTNGVNNWTEGDCDRARLASNLQERDGLSSTLSCQRLVLLDLDDPTAAEVMMERDLIVQRRVWLNHGSSALVHSIGERADESPN